MPAAPIEGQTSSLTIVFEKTEPGTKHADVCLSEIQFSWCINPDEPIP